MSCELSSPELQTCGAPDDDPLRADRRVLVADDDISIIRLLEHHLAADGFEVLTAASGTEALQIARRENPPVLIADWMMPDLDGPGLCRAIRADAGLRYTYVIILTSHRELDRVVEAFEAGADDYLAKPFDRRELLVHLKAGQRIADLVRANRRLEQEMIQRQRAEDQLRLLSSAVEQSSEGIAVSDVEGRLLFVNPAFASMHGYERGQLVGQSLSICHTPGQLDAVEAANRQLMETGQFVGEVWHARQDGSVFPTMMSNSLLRDAAGQVVGMIGAVRDVTEREKWTRELAEYHTNLERLVAERSTELLEAQRQILQNEKLASLGQLAAGVAHEINTPIQFVGDNLRALSDFFDDLRTLIEEYRLLAEAVRAGTATSESVESVEKTEEQYDLAYILDDAPKAIEQGLEGVERVANIVRAMKDFSHVDRGQVSTVDINRALQTTLTVCRNEYKYVADVETDFEKLPTVECYASELNQVFLNIVVNAAHAIADTGQRGRITIRTRPEEQHVRIEIQDSGSGIPEEARSRVFDPFFTTKPVGKGTGQGLNIAYQIVVKKHGGTLDFDTASGKGTTFRIRLPIQQAQVTETS